MRHMVGVVVWRAARGALCCRSWPPPAVPVAPSPPPSSVSSTNTTLAARTVVWPELVDFNGLAPGFITGLWAPPGDVSFDFIFGPRHWANGTHFSGTAVQRPGALERLVDTSTGAWWTDPSPDAPMYDWQLPTTVNISLSNGPSPGDFFRTSTSGCGWTLHGCCCRVRVPAVWCRNPC